MKLSVVIPCYNEQDSIPLMLERFKEVIKTDDIEVILVNNGSTDNTAEVLDTLREKYTFVRTANVEVNQGYGFGILNGLSVARGEFLGWSHADLQTDPYDCIRAYQIIKEHGGSANLYVKGLRGNRPLFDRFFTSGMSIFETLYLGQALWDINAQPNIFHRNFYESWNSPPHDFSLDLYALYLARKNNLKVIRFSVQFPKRKHGKSSWNTSLRGKLKFIKRTLDFSVKLKRNL
ncbi:MAG: glycosyltransferase family 2 protein [Nitrospirae bacterium YQR-1]